MKFNCAICRKEKFNIDKRKKYFRHDFVVLCKKCAHNIAKYTKAKICSMRSPLFRKAALKGANLIIRENNKFYLSASYSDYNLLITNKKWASGLFD